LNQRDIVGERLTIAKVVKHYDDYIVTADIDRDLDKRGLPDPLVLAFYFTPHNDLINLAQSPRYPTAAYPPSSNPQRPTFARPSRLTRS
jgi:hypothetical protein